MKLFEFKNKEVKVSGHITYNDLGEWNVNFAQLNILVEENDGAYVITMVPDELVHIDSTKDNIIINEKVKNELIKEVKYYVDNAIDEYFDKADIDQLEQIARRITTISGVYADQRSGIYRLW